MAWPRMDPASKNMAVMYPKFIIWFSYSIVYVWEGQNGSHSYG